MPWKEQCQDARGRCCVLEGNQGLSSGPEVRKHHAVPRMTCPPNSILLDNASSTERNQTSKLDNNGEAAACTSVLAQFELLVLV